MIAELVSYAPNIIAAIFILCLGHICARLISGGIVTLLKITLKEKMTETDGKPSRIDLVLFAIWLPLFLLSLVIALDVLRLRILAPLEYWLKSPVIFGAICVISTLAFVVFQRLKSKPNRPQ